MPRRSGTDHQPSPDLHSDVTSCLLRQAGVHALLALMPAMHMYDEIAIEIWIPRNSSIQQKSPAQRKEREQYRRKLRRALREIFAEFMSTAAKRLPAESELLICAYEDKSIVAMRGKIETYELESGNLLKVEKVE